MTIKTEFGVKAVAGLLGAAFWLLVAVSLVSTLFSNGSGPDREVDYYIHCVDGHCTPIPADQIKPIYKEDKS